MVSPRLWRFAAAALIALTALSCTDTRNTVLPTDPTSADLVGSVCLTPAALNTLARQVFSDRGPNFNSVIGKVGSIIKALSRRDSREAKSLALHTVDFILKKLGKKNLNALPTNAQALVRGILCLAGITIGEPASTFLVMPSDQPQVLVAGDGQAGVSLPAFPVSEPTLIVVTKITTTYPLGGGPLITKLDQYPGYYEFVKQSATNAPLPQPVIVAVCPSITVPDSIRSRLRLGHQASFGFEITPPAPANFLSCPPSIASNSTNSTWLKTLASLVMPKELYAASARLGTGGIGGSAGEFSPFGPVDPVLSFGGGIGGSAGEFLKIAPPSTADTPPTTTEPTTPAPGGRVRAVPSAPQRALVLGSGNPQAVFLPFDCSIGSAGSEVFSLCRPMVTLNTRLGTPFQNVPISWQVTGGGGTIAAQDNATLACGPFAAAVSTLTGSFGKSGICWTVGGAVGANTVVATPGLGGDAISGVSFFPPTQSFTVTVPVP